MNFQNAFLVSEVKNNHFSRYLYFTLNKLIQQFRACVLIVDMSIYIIEPHRLVMCWLKLILCEQKIREKIIPRTKMVIFKVNQNRHYDRQQNSFLKNDTEMVTK